MSEEKSKDNEVIYTDVWNTGKPCHWCGAMIGEPHGKHYFV